MTRHWHPTLKRIVRWLKPSAESLAAAAAVYRPDFDAPAVMTHLPNLISSPSPARAVRREEPSGSTLDPCRRERHLATSGQNRACAHRHKVSIIRTGDEIIREGSSSLARASLRPNLTWPNRRAEGSPRDVNSH